jgi:ABC-type transport system substrate-binding protein
VLAHPAAELPRFICQKIQSQWDALGVKCSLRELPPGQVWDTDGSYDLLYLEFMIREPLTDVGRLFGTQGLVPTSDPYVALALRQIDAAENWRTAGEQLKQLHRLLFEEVTVLPLWQMVEHFAYQRGLQGVPPHPVLLYDDVQRWRVTPALEQE